MVMTDEQEPKGYEPTLLFWVINLVLFMVVGIVVAIVCCTITYGGEWESLIATQMAIVTMEQETEDDSGQATVPLALPDRGASSSQESLPGGGVLDTVECWECSRPERRPLLRIFRRK
jgi:hypothetical protein